MGSVRLPGLSRARVPWRCATASEELQVPAAEQKVDVSRQWQRDLFAGIPLSEPTCIRVPDGARSVQRLLAGWGAASCPPAARAGSERPAAGGRDAGTPAISAGAPLMLSEFCVFP